MPTAWDIDTIRQLVDHIRKKIKEFGQYTTDLDTVARVITKRRRYFGSKAVRDIKEFAKTYHFSVAIVEGKVGAPWVVFWKRSH